MIQGLKTVLLKDLATLRREVELYPDEASLWRPLPGVANPGGNLVLHMAGNLQFFFGGHLAHSGYVRDRDWEFGARDLPRKRILQEIDAAAKAVGDGLAALTPAGLDQEFPEAMNGERMPTGLVLLRLCSHLAYHLGQLNYHRRLIG
ncbi:MAG: DinB family protein [Holophaga sp.]|nr:DinB family protein [Holophaga sp.]